ncbi:transcriptional regulator [Pseudomonas aeruginosa]|uniref:transcriptional regulator n=1 Tax=Pseudomonas aeruginosa TaxID=287 RepID=UPI003DA91DFC
MIGNRLREERLRLEMSQDAFSQHCGVTKNTQVSYGGRGAQPSPDSTYLLKAIEIGVDVLYVVTGRHVPAAVKALTQEQLDILNYMSGMSEQNRADLVRVGRAMYDANQFRRMAPANSLS